VDAKRELIRHTVATLSYRGGKAVRGAPASFASFRVSPTSRTPVEILGHIGDLLDWALSIARGAEAWKDGTLEGWDSQVDRFFAALERLDAFLASDEALACPPERLFQGPIADALTHVGQLTLLRRIEGSPVRGENYRLAEITTGRVGRDQPAPVREFD
jgi:hypothetical protein